jgi:hypothetical protein
LLEGDTASDGAGIELALVKEKLTLVQRRFQTKSATTWQEVA